MTIKFKIKIPSKLQRSLETSLSKAALDIVHDIKTELRKNIPESYEDRGGELSTLLKNADLEPQSGALLKAWEKTISSIRRTRLKNTISFQLFTTTYLDEGTPWIGITNPPTQKKYTNPQLSDAINNTTKSRNFDHKDYGAVIQSDSGYRPLPSTTAISINGKGTKFSWYTNPYPTYGYWLLYEQGYFNDVINYPDSSFIKDAYRSIIGESVNQMFSTGSVNLRLSESAMRKFNKRIKENLKKSK